MRVTGEGQLGCWNVPFSSHLGNAGVIQCVTLGVVLALEKHFLKHSARTLCPVIEMGGFFDIGVGTNFSITSV